MKRFATGLMVFGAASLSIGCATAQNKQQGTTASAPIMERVTNNHEIADTVSLDNLVVGSDGRASGSLVNHSRFALRSIKVLVRHAWLWRDEQHPGADNPARAAYYIHPTDLPSGEHASFSYAPSPSLPQRSDGRFKTTVEIVSFEEVGF